IARAMRNAAKIICFIGDPAPKEGAQRWTGWSEKPVNIVRAHHIRQHRRQRETGIRRPWIGRTSVGNLADKWYAGCRCNVGERSIWESEGNCASLIAKGALPSHVLQLNLEKEPIPYVHSSTADIDIYLRIKHV